MKFFIILAAGVLMTAFQMMLADALRLGPYAPDLLLILAIFLGASFDFLQGALILFVLGYISDVAAGGVVGLSSALYLAAFFITRITAAIFYAKSKLFPVIMALSLYFLQRLLVEAVLWMFVSTGTRAGIAWGSLAFRSAVNAVAAPLVFRALSFVDVLSARREYGGRAAKPFGLK